MNLCKLNERTNGWTLVKGRQNRVLLYFILFCHLYKFSCSSGWIKESEKNIVIDSSGNECFESWSVMDNIVIK